MSDIAPLLTQEGNICKFADQGFSCSALLMLKKSEGLKDSPELVFNQEHIFKVYQILSVLLGVRSFVHWKLAEHLILAAMATST